MAAAAPTPLDPPFSRHPELSGYQATANLMGGFPNMAIFRRFMNAGALDLLYRQAELQYTILQWADIAEKDVKSGAAFDVKFAELLLSTDDPNKQNGMQRRTWLEVSEKLGDYYDRLFKFQRVCNLSAVDKHHLGELRHHLRDVDQGAGYLKAYEAEIYCFQTQSEINKLIDADFTSIAKSDEPDVFTQLARGPAVDFFHRIFGLDHKKNIKVPRIAQRDPIEYPWKAYPPEHAIILARVLYAALTSILVTVAIISLNYFKSLISRILLIMVHNLLFTIAMALFAKGKPGELFGVAAAYAAVLVVFASGQLE